MYYLELYVSRKIPPPGEGKNSSCYLYGKHKKARMKRANV
jgi:hypothetical protein